MLRGPNESAGTGPLPCVPGTATGPGAFLPLTRLHARKSSSSPLPQLVKALDSNSTSSAKVLARQPLVLSALGMPGAPPDAGTRPPIGTGRGWYCSSDRTGASQRVKESAPSVADTESEPGSAGSKALRSTCPGPGGHPATSPSPSSPSCLASRPWLPPPPAAPPVLCVSESLPSFRAYRNAASATWLCLTPPTQCLTPSASWGTSPILPRDQSTRSLIPL